MVGFCELILAWRSWYDIGATPFRWEQSLKMDIWALWRGQHIDLWDPCRAKESIQAMSKYLRETDRKVGIVAFDNSRIYIPMQVVYQEMATRCAGLSQIHRLFYSFSRPAEFSFTFEVNSQCDSCNLFE